MALKAGKWTYTKKELAEMTKEATKRGKQEATKKLDAVDVRYDKYSKRVVIELENDATLLVPVNLIQGLQGVSDKDLSNVESLGDGIFWPKPNVSIGIAGLLAGVFGNQAWMAEIGRIGGSKTSKTKKASSRANGKLGGRPRKSEQKKSTGKQSKAA